MSPRRKPRIPVIFFFKKVKTAAVRLKIPLTKKRKSPEIEKSVKGEFFRISVVIFMLEPSGLKIINIPAKTAPTPTNDCKIPNEIYNIFSCFVL